MGHPLSLYIYAFAVHGIQKQVNANVNVNYHVARTLHNVTGYHIKTKTMRKEAARGKERRRFSEGQSPLLSPFRHLY